MLLQSAAWLAGAGGGVEVGVEVVGTLERPQSGWLGNLTLGLFLQPRLSLVMEVPAGNSGLGLEPACQHLQWFLIAKESHVAKSYQGGGEIQSSFFMPQITWQRAQLESSWRIGAVRITHLPWWEKAMKEIIWGKGEIGSRCLREYNWI